MGLVGNGAVGDDAGVDGDVGDCGDGLGMDVDCGLAQPAKIIPTSSAAVSNGMMNFFMFSSFFKLSPSIPRGASNYLYAAAENVLHC